jgi:membrane protease YdiL (CAAX protease family)
MPSSPPPRSWMQQIFMSADEQRLRAAWRLLLHGLLAIILATVLSIPAAILIILSGNLATLDGRTVLAVSAPGTALAFTGATFIARRMFDRRSFRSLGFGHDRHTVADLLLGFALSGVMQTVIFLAEWGAGWLRPTGWAWESSPLPGVLLSGLGTLAIFILVGFYEELFSRGYQLQNLADGLNMTWGVLLSSVIFGVMHLQNPNAGLGAVLGVLAAGLLFAFSWVRTRRLWLPIGLHIGWNFFEGAVFGFPVSGLAFDGLIRQQAAGPPLLTGGAFGPEAGLVVLPSLALGAVLILLATRQRQPRSRPESS